MLSAKVLRYHLSNCDYSFFFILVAVFFWYFSSLSCLIVSYSHLFPVTICHFNVCSLVKFIYIMYGWMYVSFKCIYMDLSLAFMRFILRAHQINIDTYHKSKNHKSPASLENKCVSKMGWIICHSHALNTHYNFSLFFSFIFYKTEGERKRRLLFFIVGSLKEKAVVYQNNKEKTKIKDLICVPFVTRYSHLSHVGCVLRWFCLFVCI